MQCWLCESEDETRDKFKHFDLCVIGSEGVVLCHDCEIMLIEHLRNIRRISSRVKMRTYKRSKGVLHE